MIARETAEHERSIAYFCMEIGLDEHIRTYSGGLGVLAGDTLRSAADLNIPMMAVTLLYRQGHFRQVLDSDTGQREEPGTWAVAEYLEEMPDRITVPVEGRTVHLRCWKLDITGINGSTVPIYFLDADLEKNSEWDRNLTHLYLLTGPYVRSMDNWPPQIGSGTADDPRYPARPTTRAFRRGSWVLGCAIRRSPPGSASLLPGPRPTEGRGPARRSPRCPRWPGPSVGGWSGQAAARRPSCS